MKRTRIVGAALAALTLGACERQAVIVPEVPSAPVRAAPAAAAQDLAVGPSADGKPPLLGSDPYGLLSKKVPSASPSRERVDPSKLDPSALMAAERKVDDMSAAPAEERDPRAVARGQIIDPGRPVADGPISGTVIDVTADTVATRVIRGSGRPHVLLLYGAYCPVCREALPGFVDAARAYQGRKVGFTLASVDKDRDRFAGYTSTLRGAFEPLWITPGVPGTTAQAMKRMGIAVEGDRYGVPLLAVFDRSGKVVLQGHGEAMAEIGSALDGILSQDN